MKKFRIQKSILIIFIIISLLLPNIATAVEGANDLLEAQNSEEDSIINENTTKTDETEKNSNSSSDNQSEEELENTENVTNSSIESNTVSNENVVLEDTNSTNTTDATNTTNTTNTTNETNTTNTTNTLSSEELTNSTVEETEDLKVNTMTANLEDNIATIDAVSEVEVQPGNGTLQQAINNAPPGATLKLVAGGQYTGGDEITIKRSINIITPDGGKASIIPSIVIDDEDDTKNTVRIEGTNIANTTPTNLTKVHYDIRKPVDLTLKNVDIFYVRGHSNIKDTGIKLSSGSSGTNLNVEDSQFVLWGSSIQVESSNNNLTFKKVTTSSTKILNLSGSAESGPAKNNTITFESSNLSVTSNKAITMANQDYLTMEFVNTTVTAHASGGTNPVHVISFEGGITNSKISIKGKSTMQNLASSRAGSSIFNFGTVQEESNTIFVEKEATLSPNTVDGKYHTDGDSVIVGVFDIDGDLTIQSHPKESIIEDFLKSLPISQDPECKWYEQDADERKEFDIKSEVKQNMDLFPVLPVKVKVHIDGDSEYYDVNEGSSLDDAFNKYSNLQGLKNKLDEIKEEERFSRFLDQNGYEINFKEPIVQETTIVPKYKVYVQVEGIEDNKITLEQGQSLSEASSLSDNANMLETLEKLENLDYKAFSKYINTKTNEEVDYEETLINEDITIKPTYTVTITIEVDGKDSLQFTLDENKTLNDLSNEDKEKIKNLVIVDNKSFTEEFSAEFKKSGKNDNFTYETKINEHVTLKPKYDIKISIEGIDNTVKETYVLPEGTILTNEQINHIIDETLKIEGKTIARFTNEKGEEIGLEALKTYAFKENMILIPEYEDKIKVTIKLDDVTKYELEGVPTGSNINSLLNEGSPFKDTLKPFMEYLESLNKEFYYFVEENADEKQYKFDTPLPRDIILVPRYKVLITVSPKYEEEKTFEMPEGKTLENIKDDLEQFKLTNKTLKGFVYKNDDSDVNIESDKIEENTIIIPKYTIEVTVTARDGEVTKKDIPEGSTLENIKKIEEFKKFISPSNKTFQYFASEDNETLEDSYEFKGNTTIIPKYTIDITVVKKDKSTTSYTISEGTVLHQQDSAIKEFVKESNLEFAEEFKKLNEVNGEYVETADILDFYTVLYENTILMPKYNAKITITKADGTVEEFFVEEGQTLNDIKDNRFEETKKKEDREFSRFIDDKNKDFDPTIPIDSNINLTPVFSVTIKIGDKTYKLDEEKTLKDLFDENPEAETYWDELKNSKTEFSRFVDQNGNTIEEETVFDYNAIINPKFKVTIKIGEKTYLLEEGKTLKDLFNENSEAKEYFENFKISENRPFSRFVDQNGNTIDENTVINNDIVISGKFKVTITVENPDGTTEKIFLEEGKTLSDLTKEENDKLQKIKNNHGDDERFVGFKNSKDNKDITNKTIISEDITIKPIYEKIPVISGGGGAGDSNGSAPLANVLSPKTADNIINYVIGSLVGLACILIAVFLHQKNNKINKK